MNSKSTLSHPSAFLTHTRMLLLVVMVAGALIAVQNVRAQINPLLLDPIRLTALPARLGDSDYSLHGKPGQLVQAVVHIKNSSSTTQTIQTLIEDFTVIDDTGKPVPVTPLTPSKWQLADWVTLTPTNQVVESGQVADIQLSIQVPSDALPGGRYAMVMSAPVIDKQAAGSGTGIAQQVGTLLYFVVDGQINEESYISNVQAKQWYEFGPVPFSFEMDNRSDIHIHPNIQVAITNMLGAQADTFVIEPKNIFPGEKTTFNGIWQRKWGLGKYSGRITANYGTQGKVALGEFSFWLIPIRAILGVIFVFSSGIYVLWAVWQRAKEIQGEEKEEERLGHRP